MKKFLSTDLGGAPVTKEDLRTIFNDDIWDAMEALLLNANSAIVVSGCVLSDNAGNFDMTAGVVFIDGQFLRVGAVTNQTFTKYIRQATAVNDSRTFADGGTHDVATSYTAEVNAAAGGGQVLTISSLTSLDGKRLGVIVGKVNGSQVNTSDIMTSAFYTPTTDVDTIFAHGIQMIKHDAANAPGSTSGQVWVLTTGKGLTNGSYFQIAQQVAGSGAGDIYYREYPSPSGPWDAWGAAINT